MFTEEKPHLMGLPLTQFAYFSQALRTVQDDGLIQVNNCFYAALPAPLHSKVIVRIYKFEIEIINPQTLEVIRRHCKSHRKGMVFMDEKDRIFNPSRQTQYLLTRAAEIGPNTKDLCKMLFAEEGRPGQRRMRGIVDLARRFEACHIEQAAEIAISKGLRKCRVIRRMVQDISKQQKPAPQPCNETLIQSHQLIRPPEDYQLFFETHAAGKNNNKDKKTLH
jgi:hypothetical protein